MDEMRSGLMTVVSWGHFATCHAVMTTHNAVEGTIVVEEVFMSGKLFVTSALVDELLVHDTTLSSQLLSCLKPYSSMSLRLLMASMTTSCCHDEIDFVC